MPAVIRSINILTSQIPHINMTITQSYYFTRFVRLFLISRSKVRMETESIVEHQRDKVKGACREPHNKELHVLYSSPNVFRRIKSRRMKWTGNMASQRQGRVKASPLRSETSCYQFFSPRNILRF